MRILIVGKNGQLAWELERTAPSGLQVEAMGRPDLDISNRRSLLQALKLHKPDAVINSSAYTAVDQAETDRESAFSVNESGVRNLAFECVNQDIRLLQVSTDFVFDGSQSKPYKPEDKPSPLGVYGLSKFRGEQAIAQVGAKQSVIVRTSWVYSSHGGNFVKTMLRLMAEKPELNVVCDQVGSPTWAFGLANWLWAVVQNPEVSGTFHWADAGVASWYDFAMAIQEFALQKGILSKRIAIHPIPSSAYPTPAKRPSYSVLDKSDAEHASGLKCQYWREQLCEMLEELR